MAGEWQLRPCDVCLLLDNDRHAKPCLYCPMCDAWICEPDQSSWIRRAQAAAIRQLGGCEL